MNCSIHSSRFTAPAAVPCAGYYYAKAVEIG